VTFVAEPLLPKHTNPRALGTSGNAGQTNDNKGIIFILT
jgi:hypothetical protein